MTRGALMVRATRRLQRLARLLTKERTGILELLNGLQPGTPEPGVSAHEHLAEVAAALYDQEESLTIR